LVDSFVSKYSQFTSDDEKTITATFTKNDFDFCIGFNTTAFFEAILYNLNVIQYISGNDEFIVESLNTVNGDNLLDKLSTIKKKQINSEFFFAKCKLNR
jgi:hypothetical protein